MRAVLFVVIYLYRCIIFECYYQNIGYEKIIFPLAEQSQ